jgi:hypothetical protein
MIFCIVPSRHIHNIEHTWLRSTLCISIMSKHLTLSSVSSPQCFRLSFSGLSSHDNLFGTIIALVCCCAVKKPTNKQTNSGFCVFVGFFFVCLFLVKKPTNKQTNSGLCVQNWQHYDCMGLTGAVEDGYLCEICLPRPLSKVRADLR